MDTSDVYTQVFQSLMPLSVSPFVTPWHQMAPHGRIYGSRMYLGGGKQAPIVSTGAKDSNPLIERSASWILQP